MKKNFSLVLLIVLFGVGCASQKAWVYSTNRWNEAPVLVNKTAVILPFNDSRDSNNKNRLLLYAIPLFPFGWANFNVPEGVQMHIFSGLWTNYKPTEDYPKALAEELNSAKIFSEAYFDFKQGDGDFVIKGKILNTKYKGKMISYGLSVYGPILWLIGLPAGTVSNELTLELSCMDKNSNDVIFSKTYTAPIYKKIGWIYVMPNGFNYPNLLRDVYRNFVEDLRMNMSKYSTQ